MIGNNVVAGKLESLRAAVRTMLTQLTVVEDEDIRGNYQGVLERADSVLETGVNRERKIMADTNLSATGQRNAIQALWKETLSALEFVGKKATSLQEAASSLRAELFAIPPTPKGVDPIMAYMREAEIRAWLSRLSKAEVLSKYMVAAQSGNAEMIRAVKLAPREPMIEPAELDKIDAERVRQTKVKETTRLDSLNTAADALASQSAAFMRSLSLGFDVNVKPTPPARSTQSLIGGGHPVAARAENF